MGKINSMRNLMAIEKYHERKSVIIELSCLTISLIEQPPSTKKNCITNGCTEISTRENPFLAIFIVLPYGPQGWIRIWTNATSNF